jgi:phosphoribosyl 1,2-cyclic phosphodiesterase
MAKLITLGSSSSGNAYILDCGNEQLIIELGVSWKDILKGLDYNLTKVRACLVSHQHL